MHFGGLLVTLVHAFLAIILTLRSPLGGAGSGSGGSGSGGSGSGEDGGAPTPDAGDACATPSSIGSDEDCRAYAQCCGFSAEDTTAACSYSRVNDLARCECAASDHKVRCEDKSGAVVCQCE